MKTLQLAFICVILFTSNINAQITVREDAIEKPTLKPKQYDSLINLQFQINPIDYKQYIGQKVFFIPRSNKFKSNTKPSNSDNIITFLHSKQKTTFRKPGARPFIRTDLGKALYDFLLKTGAKGKDTIKYPEYIRSKTEYEAKQNVTTDIYLPTFILERINRDSSEIIGRIGTKTELVENKYFSIINIDASKYSDRIQTYSELKEFPVNNPNDNLVLALRISLKDLENNDTIFWFVNQARFINNFPFILLPYFEKNKELYYKKDLRAEKNIDGLIDLKTGAIVNIKTGDKWNCNDVCFIALESSFYCKPFYVLKNDNGAEVKFSIENDFTESFITEEKFIERDKLAKMAEQEKLKLKAEQEKKKKEDEIKFKTDCINRFGDKLGKLISEGNVILGMTTEMCRLSWGEPIEVNRTTVKGLVHEQWVYSWSNYLYFDNGKLTAIQD